MMMNNNFKTVYTTEYSRELAYMYKAQQDGAKTKDRDMYRMQLAEVVGLKKAAVALGISEEEIDDLETEIIRVRVNYEDAIAFGNFGVVTCNYYEKYPDFIF